jgi:hypothetical protein
MRREGHVARIGGKRNVYKFLARKPEGYRSLGRLRRGWTIILKWFAEK